MAVRRLGLLFGLFGSARRRFLGFVTDSTSLVKTIHAARSVHNALFAGVERVALRAQINADGRQCGMRVHFRAARGARDRCLNVIWMDSVFHFFPLSNERGESMTHPSVGFSLFLLRSLQPPRIIDKHDARSWSIRRSIVN